MSNKISDEALVELEEAIGKENVSADPGILETYTYMNGLAQGMFGFYWGIRPVCTRSAARFALTIGFSGARAKAC